MIIKRMKIPTAMRQSLTAKRENRKSLSIGIEYNRSLIIEVVVVVVVLVVLVIRSSRKELNTNDGEGDDWFKQMCCTNTSLLSFVCSKRLLLNDFTCYR